MLTGRELRAPHSGTPNGAPLLARHVVAAGQEQRRRERRPAQRHIRGA
ncbi:hypothetical protein SFR_1815 [Streptomyces sp. FR-008]|nr:hypothetical protein SFR_1815 [Streptomyces sp. FR-008]